MKVPPAIILKNFFNKISGLLAREGRLADIHV